MAMIDKVQATVEKLTNDDQRMNAAELAALRQAHSALQIGLLKVEFFIKQAQDGDVRNMLEKWRDDVIKPNLNKPARMFEKAGIPYLNLDVENRVNAMPDIGNRVFTDKDILLESVLTTAATIETLQTGALVAIRGDVRDFFLNTRDAAFGVWRDTGRVAYQKLPELMPPSMTGKPQST